MKNIYLLITAAAISGCVSLAPTSQELQAQNYPEKPSMNAIKSAVAEYEIKYGTLKDPYSAQFQCGNPRKGGAWTAATSPSGKHYGYIVQCVVNAKNSYGAYTGPEEKYYLLRGNPGSYNAIDLRTHEKSYLE